MMVQQDLLVTNEPVMGFESTQVGSGLAQGFEDDKFEDEECCICHGT